MSFEASVRPPFSVVLIGNYAAQELPLLRGEVVASLGDVLAVGTRNVQDGPLTLRLIHRGAPLLSDLQSLWSGLLDVHNGILSVFGVEGEVYLKADCALGTVAVTVRGNSATEPDVIEVIVDPGRGGREGGADVDGA